MKTVFLALLIALISPSLFGQRMILKDKKETWLPEIYTSLSSQEQRFIANLNGVDEKNKQFVQLIFDAGSFSNCGVGTALRSNKLFFTVVDKKTSTRYSYVINFKKALVNDYPFVSSDNSSIHLLVFEQETKSVEEFIPQTVLVYFFYSPKGDMQGMQLFVKKKIGGVLSRASAAPVLETSYQLTCKSK